MRFIILLIINVVHILGENFVVMMSGKTYTVSIELEKQVVRFFDTYNTMMRQQSFKITNKSDHVLTYMCMKNDCVYYGTGDFILHFRQHIYPMGNILSYFYIIMV